MKKLIIILFLILIVINVNYARDDSYVFKQNDPASLIVSCFNENNSICGDSTNCQITVIRPNSSILLNNASMTYAGAYYNYSLGTNETTELGIYSAIVTCQSSTDGFSTFNYLITRSGKTLDTSESIIYFLLTTAVFIIFLLGLFASMKIPYRNKTNDEGFIVQITRTKYLKLGSILLTYLLFLWFLNLLIGVSDNFVNLGIYYGFISFIFQILIGLAWPMFVLFFIWGIFEMIRDFNRKKMIRELGKA